MAMNIVEIKFWTIDDWGRPVFRCDDGCLFGSLDKLFDWGTSEEEVLKTVTEEDITWFGYNIDDDPMGTPIAGIKIIKN